jgi:hypothetical protein
VAFSPDDIKNKDSENTEMLANKYLAQVSKSIEQRCNLVDDSLMYGIREFHLTIYKNIMPLMLSSLDKQWTRGAFEHIHKDVLPSVMKAYTDRGWIIVKKIKWFGFRNTLIFYPKDTDNE